MDGKESGNFVHNTSMDKSFEYNVMVYSKTNLKNTSHFLNMSTTGSAPSLMLFDYFNYTWVLSCLSYEICNEVLCRIDGDLSDGKSVIDVPTSTSISSSPSTKVNDSPTALATPSPSPGSTSNLTGPSGKNPISNVVVGVLVGAIVVVIIMVVFILFLSVRWHEMPYLLPCLPRHQRKEPRIQAGQRETVQRSSMETLHGYMHNIDDALPARPALGEKGYLIRTDDIQGRIEALRAELAQYHDLTEYSFSLSGLSSITSIRPSESVSESRIRGPENTTASVPQILRQMTALRAQIHHLEEQLAATTQSPPYHSSIPPEENCNHDNANHDANTNQPTSHTI